MEQDTKSLKNSWWRTLWGRMGFSEKKLWDWLELLGFLATPAVLAADRFWLTAQQDMHRQEITSDANATPAAGVSAGEWKTVMTDEQLVILREWYRSLLNRNHAHFVTAAKIEQRNLLLGVPATVLAAVTGTAIFATLTISPQLWAKIAVGLLSLSAAVLASLQTFLRYGERAKQHKEAGQKFGILRRRIEAAIAEGVLPPGFFTSISKQWDQFAEEYPPLPPRIRKQESKKSEKRANELFLRKRT
jgi:hypothetical protein